MIAKELNKQFKMWRLDKYEISNVPVINKFFGSSGADFNCWGASCLYYSLVERPLWISHETMNDFIDQKFSRLRRSSKLKVNDMVAFYNRGDLIHTAVFLGRDRFFHKIGAQLCTIDSLKEIKLLYKSTSVRYYRLK